MDLSTESISLAFTSKVLKSDTTLSIESDEEFPFSADSLCTVSLHTESTQNLQIAPQLLDQCTRQRLGFLHSSCNNYYIKKQARNG